MSLNGATETEKMDVDASLAAPATPADGLTHVNKDALTAFRDKLKARTSPGQTDGLRHVKKEAQEAFHNRLNPIEVPVKQEVKQPGKYSLAEIEKGLAQSLDAFRATLKESPDNPTQSRGKSVGAESGKFISQGSAQSLDQFMQGLELKDRDDHDEWLKKIREANADLALVDLSAQLQRLGLQETPAVEGLAPKPQAQGLFSGWRAQPAKEKTPYEVQHEQKLAHAKAMEGQLKSMQAYAATHRDAPDVTKMHERRDQQLKAELKAIDAQYSSWLGGSRKAEVEKAKAALTPMLAHHLAAVRRLKPNEAEQAAITQAWQESDQYRAFQQRRNKV